MPRFPVSLRYVTAILGFIAVIIGGMRNESILGQTDSLPVGSTSFSAWVGGTPNDAADSDLRGLCEWTLPAPLGATEGVFRLESPSSLAVPGARPARMRPHARVARPPGGMAPRHPRRTAPPAPRVLAALELRL